MAKDKRAINEMIRALKTDNGVINYKKLLSVPVPERLPAMYKKNPRQTAGMIVAALTIAFEQMNLSRPMNEDQILDLADAIIDTSGEDFLSIEDLMLFLQGLTRGQYGALYESMDVAKFMEKFEVYRQTRHEAYQNIRDEQHVQFKSAGDPTRASDDTDRERELHRSALGDYLKQKYSDDPPPEK